MKTHEGWGVMLPCNPPAHYPGKCGSWPAQDWEGERTRKDFWMLAQLGKAEQEVVSLNFKWFCNLLAGLRVCSQCLAS